MSYRKRKKRDAGECKVKCSREFLLFPFICENAQDEISDCLTVKSE